MIRQLMCLFSICSALFMHSALLGAYQATDNRARAEEAKARQAEADSASLRRELLQFVIQKEDERKARARNEAQAIEVQIREQRGRMEKVQHWAIGGFETRERAKLPGHDAKSNQLARWDNSYKLARAQFLNFPEKSRGAVKSGRALDFFLTSCGTAAMQHATFLNQADALVRDLEDRLKEVQRQNGPANELEEELKLARQRRDLLQSMGHAAGEKLTQYDRERIKCLLGGSGTKLIVDLQNDPLPLDWPAILRTNADLAPYLRRIELAKKAVLKELDSGNGIGEGSIVDLTDSIDSLATAHGAAYSRFLQATRQAKTAGGAGKLQQQLAGKKFVEGLRHGVARLVEAEVRNDVGPGKFEGETVRDLIDFMTRNGLSFAEAGINAETTYLKVYRMMAGYYGDLYSAQLSAESEAQQIKMLEDRKRRLQNIDLGNTVTWGALLLEGFATFNNAP